MADRETSFQVIAQKKVIPDVQRLSLKVSHWWHIIKAENRASDLCGQDRHEIDYSLFLIGQPGIDISKYKWQDYHKMISGMFQRADVDQQWHILRNSSNYLS